jgi:hypothetical protein
MIFFANYSDLGKDDGVREMERTNQAVFRAAKALGDRCG